MIDIATASLIAGIASNATTSIDKIYRGFADFFKKRKPDENAPSPDFTIQNSPVDKAIVARSQTDASAWQSISYDQLREKFIPEDYAYIQTLSQAMQNYERQWNSAYEARSMAAGMDIGRYDAQLEFLARQISDPLLKVLSFLERMGFWLDDHYLASRDIAKQYLGHAEESKLPSHP